MMVFDARVATVFFVLAGQLLGQTSAGSDSVAYRWLRRGLDEETPVLLRGPAAFRPTSQPIQERLLVDVFARTSDEQRVHLLPVLGQKSRGPKTFLKLIDEALEAEGRYESALLDAASRLAANLDDPTAWEAMYYNELGPGSPVRNQAAAWAVAQTAGGAGLATFLRLAGNDQRVDFLIPLLAESPGEALGPDERLVVFELLANGYSNEHVRVQAVRALARCGEQGLPHMIRAYAAICAEPGGASSRLTSLLRRAMIRQTRVDYGADPDGWLRLLETPQASPSPPGVEVLAPPPPSSTLLNMSLAGSGLLFAMAGFSSIGSKRLATALAFILSSLFMGIAAINGVVTGVGLEMSGVTLSLAAMSVLVIAATIVRITQFKPWLEQSTGGNAEPMPETRTLTQRLKAAALRQALGGVRLLKKQVQSKKTLRSEVSEKAFRKHDSEPDA